MGSDHVRDARRTIDVDVGYDEAAKVYYVLGSPLAGLHVEASTFEEFVDITLDAAPDLLGPAHEGAHFNFKRAVDLMPAADGR